MKTGRILIGIVCIFIFVVVAIETTLNLYWKVSLKPRLQHVGSVDFASAETEIKRVQYVEQASHLFLPLASPHAVVKPIPFVPLSSAQRKVVDQARRLPAWFKRGDVIRKAHLDLSWMNDLEHVQLWRGLQPGAKGSPFLGVTWAFVRLASVSQMKMTQAEAWKALQEVRNLERLMLTSESHILNLQALQVIGLERDFVERHRRLFSYLNRWTLAPVEFARNFHRATIWMPNAWRWGMKPDQVLSVQEAAHSNPIFCAAMETGMSDALNFRPLLAAKDPDFFQRETRWGTEWSSICHRADFAQAWNNPRYVPRGIREWYAVWNGNSSRWLKLKHVMWWKSARALIGGQIWLEKLIDMASDEDDN